MSLPCHEEIGRYKYTDNAKIREEYDRIMKNLDDAIRDAIAKSQE